MKKDCFLENSPFLVGLSEKQTERSSLCLDVEQFCANILPNALHCEAQNQQILTDLRLCVGKSDNTK